ncbi:MAG: hypothetical protein P0116_09295 [Candidatus Nitrosocosmicus sp.]|nr:hypothetical protein [Candidatus Nitrosocosmicus sp.]
MQNRKGRTTSVCSRHRDHYSKDLSLKCPDGKAYTIKAFKEESNAKNLFEKIRLANLHIYLYWPSRYS